MDGDITADDDDETIEDDFEDVEAMDCNYDACERTYRSFRASDCTYQPYRGGRRLCMIDIHADPWDAPGDEDLYDDSDDPYRDSGLDYE